MFGNAEARPFYRPFLRGAILTVLSLGAAWGAWLLVRIAVSGSFTAAGLQEVNAHGHAQIFGWVGLAVMGMVFHLVPQLKGTPLAWPALARASFWLMAGGVVVHAVLQPLVDRWGWLGPIAIAASLAEIVAIGLVLAVVVATLRRCGRELWDFYLLAGLGWFLVQAIYETSYFAATILASTREQLLGLVATWQGPLREIQIHGFAMLMILALSQRLLPDRYGLRLLGARRGLTGLVLINAALVGIVAGLVLMRQAGHAWAGLWYLSVLVLAGSTAVVVFGLGAFGRTEHGDRSLKFVRAAYIWLLVSLAMLVALPAYQFGWLKLVAPGSAAARMGFSHAYYGAIRHAVTVGFISQMIVGLSASLVPEERRVRREELCGLWWPFALLNLGCAMRVVGQGLTDAARWAFVAAGPSGLLELTALAIWGVHVWRLMNVDRGPIVALPASENLDAMPESAGSRMHGIPTNV